MKVIVQEYCLFVMLYASWSAYERSSFQKISLGDLLLARPSAPDVEVYVYLDILRCEHSLSRHVESIDGNNVHRKNKKNVKMRFMKKN